MYTPPCRLLRHSVAEAERIVNPPLLEVPGGFSEGVTDEMREAIFREFNSLSVVFQVQGGGGGGGGFRFSEEITGSTSCSR